MCVCCISYVHIQYHAYMYNIYTAYYSTCTVNPVSICKHPLHWWSTRTYICMYVRYVKCIICFAAYICVCTYVRMSVCCVTTIAVCLSVVTAVQQELRLIKSEISQQCRQNYELERDVRMYDSKIAHLINHRITLEASYSSRLSGSLSV